MYNNYFNQSNKIYVSGLEGAKAYQVYPNTEMILLDDKESIIYDVCVDAQGRKNINSFDITPHIEPVIEYATKQDIDSLRRELNEYFKSQSTEQSETNK